jgi:hypothetical protein
LSYRKHLAHNVLFQLPLKHKFYILQCMSYKKVYHEELCG